MTLKLIEGIVDGVRSYLNSNLTAKLTSLNTEYNDGITLEAMQAIYVAEQSLASVPAFPALFVLGEQTVIQGWNPSNADSTHRITVGVLVLDQDTENLRRRLYRTLRAVWECLVEGRASRSLTSGGVAFDIGVDELPQITFGSIYTEGSRFLADAQVTFGVRILETKA